MGNPDPPVPVQRRTFEACPQSVSEMRHSAVRLAREQGADEQTLQSIALAVSEAASNAVVHAYRDDAEVGEIELEVRGGRDGLRIAVRDRGVGMAPRTDSPGLGLGMPLIANLAESLEVRTLPEGGTEVTMLFAVKTPCSA